MAVLTGMVAGAMVFSSFVVPKTNDETVCSQINANDGWRQVGEYTGYLEGSQTVSLTFVIWEKDGLCNAYYWVIKNSQRNKNPDETDCETGALRKNREGQWYAAFRGQIYFINF